MTVLTHEVAGLVFRTETDVRIPYLEDEHRQQFLIKDSPPDVILRICSVDLDSLTLPPLTAEDLRRFPYGAVILHHDDHDGAMSPLLRSPAVRARLDACQNHPEQVGLELHRFFVAIRDFARRELVDFLTPDLTQFLADPVASPELKRMFATFLPTLSATMVHSAGLIRGGKAALFLASSGGGKTTLTKSSTGVPVLSDDQVILRKEGDVFVAHATPWGRITSGRAQAPLGGLFLVERAQHFELIPLKPANVLEHLWNEHKHLYRFHPRSLKIQAFEIFYRACHQVPGYLMRFAKEYVDWDAVDAAMVR